MADPAPVSAFEGPGKGKAFFDRARTVAESGNYDYAIDMYIEGLNREPTNIEAHKALQEVALRRKIKGGKPAGGMFGAKGPLKGKTPKDLMLNAEWLLSKDPGNIGQMLILLRQAALAQYAEVIRWFGPTVILANKAKPKKDIYLELASTWEALDTVVDLKQAQECIAMAIEMTPTDMDLIARLKDLGAKLTLKEGKYAQEGTDFKDSIKDREQTKELAEQDNLSQSQDYRLKVVKQSEEDYLKNPRELQTVAKYVRALADMDTEDYENKAIEILQKAYTDLKVYRFKVTIGDLRMKQFKRNMRFLKEALKLDPTDKTLIHQIQELDKERVAFELAEYEERQQHFPTDMLIQFEYGYRLYQAKRYDDAIRSFQIAQNHPKHRADALHLLGRSFLEQGMKHEAVETLKRAIDEYELAETGDQKSKEYHYWLARAYQETDRPVDAMNVFSTITQWDIGFRDARTRLEGLRKVVPQKTA